MATYIALLRAVNVAGKSVLMAELRDCVERAGFPGAKTLLQSGNLVFESKVRSTAQLEATLQAEAKKRMKLETEFFVRTAAEWTAIVDANPYRTEARSDPAHLVLMLLKSAASAAHAQALMAAIPGRERVSVAGNHAYFVYPDGMGPSRLTLALIDRKLETRGTARNWNTVLKLATLAASMS